MTHIPVLWHVCPCIRIYNTHSINLCQETPRLQHLGLATRPKMLSSAFCSWHPSLVDPWPREVIHRQGEQSSIFHIACNLLHPFVFLESQQSMGKVLKMDIRCFPMAPVDLVSVYLILLALHRQPPGLHSMLCFWIVVVWYCSKMSLEANLRWRSDVVLEMWEQSPLKWDEENHASFTARLLYSYRLWGKIGENKAHVQNMWSDLRPVCGLWSCHLGKARQRHPWK